MLNYFRVFFLFVATVFVINKSFSCDQTSISVTNVVYNGSYYTYTAQICVGISPNWGATTSLCIDADQNILNTGGTYTSSFTSTYNYCSVELAFNGQNCASGNFMGVGPAGGTIETANTTVTGSISGGNLCFTGGMGDGGWIGPDDLRGDCSDCLNPSQLCWDVTFSTSLPISSATLVGAEGDGFCPDEIATTIPPPPLECAVPEITATVNSAASVTVCQGEALSLASNCTANCSGTNTWSGPGGFSSSIASASTTASASGTYTYANGSGSCIANVAVNVTVIPPPTATFGQETIQGCGTAMVPISFTGTGPWTFTYNAGSGDVEVTTSSNPYYIEMTTGGTVQFAMGTGVTSDACPSLEGTVSGTTNVSISPLDADAGTDWAVDIGTNHNLDATITDGLIGTTVLTSPSSTVTQTCGSGCSIPNNDPTTGYTATSINVADLGLTCTTMGFDNIPDGGICFTTNHGRTGDLRAEICLGGTCITIPEGSIGNTTYCFSRGDLLTLFDGASCTSGTITLQVWDVATAGGGPGAATYNFTSWTTTLQNVTTTTVGTTYEWSVASGDADLTYLSCTDCEDPVFNSPVSGSGCYTLTATDGAGCVITDEVCFDVLLNLNVYSFNVAIENDNSVLTWGAVENYFSNFEIQKSIDGANFETIGNVKHSEAEKYYFIDEKFKDDAYYRVKGTKNNTLPEFTEVKFLSKKQHTLKLVKVYPIPSKNFTKVELSTGYESELSYKLLDMKGQIIMEDMFKLNKGNTTFDLDLSNTSNGNYILFLNNGKEQIRTKIIKN